LNSTINITKSTQEKAKSATLQLLDYCQKENWSGYDPYDALNSKIFERLPFLNLRLFRLGLTQLLKRSPVNVRPLLLVPKLQNPKALALFLMSFVKLSKLGFLPEKELINNMQKRLMALRSPDTHYWCWGYSFPWQTRTLLVPRWAPNLVCTNFVANALLDAYQEDNDPRWLEMAVSAAEYVLNDLYWEDAKVACFAYPTPLSRSRVHNANFLGAALLCRVYALNGKEKFLDPAIKVTRYSAAAQNEEGSWDYGENSTQRWVDNFHTGYNLCALKDIGRYAGTLEFDNHVQRGFRFYRDHFFTEDGAPRYFHNRTYPIDSHSVAQSIITLLKLNKICHDTRELAVSVFEWSMSNMRDKKGYFYYQSYPDLTIRTSYMRWTQAWMLLALCTLLENSVNYIG
jgi:hypothetical protein